MKRLLITLFVVSFIQAILHNLGHPVTPALVRSLDIPDKMFGVFFSAMSLGLMIGAPLWGVLGDRGHKKFYIIFGLLLYSIGQIGFGYVGNQAWMVFFRFLSGFGVAASATLFISKVIDLSLPSNKAKNLAIFSALAALGGSLGYGLGGYFTENQFLIDLLHTSDYRNVFLVQGILNTIYALGLIYFLQGCDDLKQANVVKIKKKFRLRDLKNTPFTLVLFLISLTFATIGSVNISKYIDVYFNELGYSPNDLGTFVMVTGFVSIIASLVLVPILVKLKKDLTLMIVIHIINAFVILFVFRQANFLLFIYTIFMIYVVAKAVYQPFEQSFISGYAKEGATGSLMGIRQAFFSMGLIIGPLIGGWLYEIRPLLVFDVSALMFAVSLFLLIWIFIRQKRHEKKNVDQLD